MERYSSQSNDLFKQIRLQNRKIMPRDTQGWNICPQIGLGRSAHCFSLRCSGMDFDTDRRDFRLSNRAYVVLQDIVLTPIKVADGVNWAVIPQWQNGGNTTTEGMTARLNLVRLGESPGVRSGFSRCDVALKNLSVPILLGPKQISNASFFEEPGNVFADFQSGKIEKLYVWGWAELPRPVFQPSKNY